MEGNIATIAGTGERGYSGDGGPATAAWLAYPRGLKVTADGQIFVAESGNDRIRKIDAAGIITTFAGNGMPFLKGDGGLATSAQLGYPYELLRMRPETCTSLTQARSARLVPTEPSPRSRARESPVSQETEGSDCGATPIAQGGCR